jgi:pyruvate/2-oxoglutarate dehydrogenase complex dihydrolipoamide acyltransferase (E2) component
MGFHRARNLPAWRKVALGTWGPPRSPTAYGSIDLDCERASAYIEALRASTGERVTLTHLVGKAAALAIAAAPEVNGFASFGRLMLRETVDVFFQVAFFDHPTHPEPGIRTRSDANLAGAKVSDADKKSVVEIARELREKAEALRLRGESPTARIASAMKRLPGPLASVAMRAAEFVTFDAGFDMTPFGIPEDPFGSCMVTNVGVFGIREGHAPLIPYARVPIILTLGALRAAPAVDEGKLVVRRQVTIGVAFDHRVMDGYHAGMMARRFTDAFAEPDRLLA